MNEKNEEKKYDRAALQRVDPISGVTTEALPIRVNAEGNANGAYIRLTRRDNGVWIALGDDDTEREVWFSETEASRIASALNQVGSETDSGSEASAPPHRSEAPK